MTQQAYVSIETRFATALLMGRVSLLMILLISYAIEDDDHCTGRAERCLCGIACNSVCIGQHCR